jgi:O-antigen/teichoic acid export membrane protein
MKPPRKARFSRQFQGERRNGFGLLQGAAIMGAAAVITKLLGTMQKIPLQNLAGDSAFGIYNAVYPLYILILYLATAGFPIVVSKFVADCMAQGDRIGARRIVKIASVMLAGTGVICFALLYLGAGRIAAWIGISQTERAIQSVSFALLISPAMAVLRGYFQGMHNMMPTAVSQVVEQLVRVMTMVALLLCLISMDAPMDWIAAGATFGAVTGAAAGLLVMLVYWYKDKREAGKGEMDTGGLNGSSVDTRDLVMKVSGLGSEEIGKGPERLASISNVQLVKRIAAYAIPISIGTILVPILTLVDTFTMPRLLEVTYLTEGAAMRQFGLYNRGLPLVQLVAMIVSTMSVVLIPVIAEAKARGEAELVRSRSEVAVRIAWMLGLGASFGLAFTAAPVNIMLYKTDEGTWTIVILAFTALFSTLNTVMGSVLQGLGAVRTPAVALLIAVVLKTLGNVWLMPRWGIEGAALSAVIAYAAAAGLTLVQLIRCTGVRFALRRYAVAPTLGVCAMGVCLAALQLGAKAAAAWLPEPERWAYSAIALLCVGGGALAYALALLRSGAISREELRLMPELDRKLTPVLLRYKLLPHGSEQQKR